MMMLAILSLLAGMVLGQRFKVLILIPAIAASLIVAVAAGIARADDIWSIVMMAVLAATSLQIGYLGGTAIRVMIVATRASRRRHASLQASATVQRPAH
jgi:hypothetical protein